jgi:hypothetical protein
MARSRVDDALGEPDTGWIEVVGVTTTGRYETFSEEPTPFVYLSLTQRRDVLRFLHARTTVAPESMLSPVVEAVRALEPEIVPIDALTMPQALGGGLGFFLPRLASRFASILGALAVALAVVGLYGLIAYTAARRRREIGVRVALGARPADILRLITAPGMRFVAAGIAMGLFATIAAARFVDQFLFGVSGTDGVILIAVAALLAAVTLLACLIPAIRSARVEPASALRDA